VSIPQVCTRRGKVNAFDEPVGLGTLVDDDDGAEHPFHCTAIGDGSRDVPVGVAVTYRLAPARHGRTEATDIWPVASG
jgi:cold shock CspA family protein